MLVHLLSAYMLVGTAAAVEPDRLPFGTHQDLVQCLDEEDDAACEQAAWRIDDPAWAAWLRHRSASTLDGPDQPTLLMLQCAAEDAAACAGLASVLLSSDRPIDHLRGAGVALRACSLGNGFSCDMVGASKGDAAWQRLLTPVEGKGSLEERLTRAAKSCGTAKEPARACADLAAIAWSSTSPLPDVIAAASRACDTSPGGPACGLKHDLEDPNGPYDPALGPSFLLATRLCAADQVSAGCTLASGLATTGRFAPWGTLAALALQQSRCNTGDGGGCATMTAIALSPMMSRWEARCDAAATGRDDPRTCTLLSTALRFGVGRPKDEARADQLATLACERGDPAPCGWKADKLWDEDRFAESYAAYKRACDAGNGFACGVVGRVELDGEDGTPKDVTAGLAHLRRGRDLGSPYATVVLGEAYMGSAVGKPDPAESFRLLARACSAGETSACGSTGAIGLLGYPSPLSVPDSLALTRWACELEDSTSCEYLAIAYDGGANVLEKNEARRRWALTRACELSPGATPCDDLEALGAGPVEEIPLTEVPRRQADAWSFSSPWADDFDQPPSSSSDPNGERRPDTPQRGGPSSMRGSDAPFILVSAGSQRSWTTETQSSVLRITGGLLAGPLYFDAGVDLVSDARWRPKVARSYWRTTGFFDVGVSVPISAVRFEVAAGPALGGYREGPGDTNPISLSYGARELVQLRFAVDKFTAGVRLEQHQLWRAGSKELDHVTAIYGLLGVTFE